MSNTAFEVRSGLAVNNNILEVNALSGQVGINTAANNVTLTIAANDGIYIPTGNTGQRPTVNGGIIRLNTDTNLAEWASPVAWKNLTVPLNAGRCQVNDGWMANSTTANGVYGNTNIVFIPYNGNGVRINGAVYELPAGGLTSNATSCYLNGVQNSHLAGQTVYYVYVFNNNGTLTLDFSTTGHITSTTPGNIGTEIKLGDDTRSLVGMTYTVSNTLFPTVYFAMNNRYPGAATRGVSYTLSWFNRRWQWLTGNFYSGTNQPGGVWVPFATLSGLMWGDEPYHTAYLNGFVYMFGYGADGVSPGVQVQYIIAENGPQQFVSQQTVLSSATQGSFAGIGHNPFNVVYNGTGNAQEGLNTFYFDTVLYNYQVNDYIQVGVRYRG